MTTRPAPGIITVDPAKVDQYPPSSYDVTSEQIEQATATIKRYLPEGPDRQQVLDALFGVPNKALEPHGTQVTEERTAWLKRCRAHFAALGRPLAGTHVPADMQREYEDATGDMRPTARPKGRVK